MAEVKLWKVKFLFTKKKVKWVSFHTKKRIHKPRHKRSSKDFKVGAELSGFNSSRLKVLVTRRALSIVRWVIQFLSNGYKIRYILS